LALVRLLCNNVKLKKPLLLNVMDKREFKQSNVKEQKWKMYASYVNKYESNA
jgi:hypothetical protein